MGQGCEIRGRVLHDADGRCCGLCARSPAGRSKCNSPHAYIISYDFSSCDLPILCLVSFLFFRTLAQNRQRSVLLGNCSRSFVCRSRNNPQSYGKNEGSLSLSDEKAKNPAAISAVWFVGIIGGAFLLSLLLWKLNFGKSRTKSDKHLKV